MDDEMLDTARTARLDGSQPMPLGRRHVRRSSNNNTPGRRGQPGGEKSSRLRRCASYPRYQEAIDSQPALIRDTADGDVWYCWTCCPRMEFLVWLYFHKLGFPVVLPLVIDRSAKQQQAIPAFSRYGMIALRPLPGNAYDFQRKPSQEGHSPSWRIITEVVSVGGALPRARPVPVSSEFMAAWRALGRDDGVVEFRRERERDAAGSLVDVLKFVKNAPDQAPTMFRRGEMLRIIDGAFQGFPGSVDAERPQHDEVDVSVVIFGRSTKVTLQRDAVERT